MIDKLRGALRSMTIWVNGLLLAAFPLVEIARGSLPEIGLYLSPDVFKWVGLTVVVLNIALRFKTTTSLQDKAP